MENPLKKNYRLLIARAGVLAGNAILRSFQKAGYGKKELGGEIFTPSRKELNYLDSDNVKQWLKINAPDVVVVAAGKVGGIYANMTYPSEFLLENLKIELNLIENSWKYGVRRLLFLGSSCIYPKNSSCPIKEELLMEGKLEPTNEYYALAKIAGLKLCESLRKQYGFDALTLMPTNLYGPGDNYDNERSHVLAALIKRFIDAKALNKKEVFCWGTGNPKREFLHSNDLGDACVFVLENWDPTKESAPKNKDGELLNMLNVGTGLEISIKELSKKIADIVNFKGEIIWDPSKPDGVSRKVLDVTRLNSLGWEAKISLSKGLEKEIKNYKRKNEN